MARRASKKSVWSQIAEGVSSAVSGAVADRLSGAETTLTDHLGPWSKHFLATAVPKIEATLRLGQGCEAGGLHQGREHPCDETAALVCASCRRFSCLAHSFVSWRGEALCWKCAAGAVAAAARARGDAPRTNSAGGGPPPPRQSQADKTRFCLRVLGLEPGASWEEVASAFRKLGAKWHPDRADAAQKAEYEEKFKRISEAYHALKEMGYGGTH